jgi:hypothetical protein
MTSYIVTLPNDKQDYFQEFLSTIGATYEKTNIDIQITSELKQLLDERLQAPETDFIDARSALQELQKNYGL